jgi:hypothetical protein
VPCRLWPSFLPSLEPGKLVLRDVEMMQPHVLQSYMQWELSYLHLSAFYVSLLTSGAAPDLRTGPDRRDARPGYRRLQRRLARSTC